MDWDDVKHKFYYLKKINPSRIAIMVKEERRSMRVRELDVYLSGSQEDLAITIIDDLNKEEYKEIDIESIIQKIRALSGCSE